MSKHIYFNLQHEKYGPFSNFYNCMFTYKDMIVYSVEAAFQCEKTIDCVERYRIAHLSPALAKKAGRKVKLREDWEQVKFQVMFDACYDKFSQNLELRDLLLSTGDALLIENTTGWHDNIWGYCSCPKCVNEVHQNLHGKVLMLVRDTLIKESS